MTIESINSNILSKRKKSERVQTGVRLEKRLVKVLKALAEYYDISFGELMESILLHSLDGQNPFDEKTLKLITDLKHIYDLDLGHEDSSLQKAESTNSNN
ncbi:MAG TPA: hypothetical protein VKA34_18360 [Balneolales bacterium]|nr:hypothetical protein [Balneolales bacterium]